MLAAVITTESATFPLAKQIDHQDYHAHQIYNKTFTRITFMYRARYVTILLAVPATKQRLQKLG